MEDKLWTIIKGMVGKLVLAVQLDMPDHLIVMELLMMVNDFSPLLMEHEGISVTDKIPVDMVIKWTILYNMSTDEFESMSDQKRAFYAGVFRNAFTGPLDPEMDQLISSFENGDDLSVWEDYLENMEDDKQ